MTKDEFIATMHLLEAAGAKLTAREFIDLAVEANPERYGMCQCEDIGRHRHFHPIIKLDGDIYWYDLYRHILITPAMGKNKIHMWNCGEDPSYKEDYEKTSP